MIDKLPDFLKFFVTLSNAAKVNVILLCLVLAIGYWSYDTQSKLQVERDNFKDRYEKLYDKYQVALDSSQARQTKAQADCMNQFKTYRETKDAEVQKLVDNYMIKYNDLLDQYKELAKKIK